MHLTPHKDAVVTLISQTHSWSCSPLVSRHFWRCALLHLQCSCLSLRATWPARRTDPAPGGPIWVFQHREQLLFIAAFIPQIVLLETAFQPFLVRRSTPAWLRKREAPWGWPAVKPIQEPRGRERGSQGHFCWSKAGSPKSKVPLLCLDMMPLQ